jgi:hypothetical protein
MQMRLPVSGKPHLGCCYLMFETAAIARAARISKLNLYMKMQLSVYPQLH